MDTYRIVLFPVGKFGYKNYIELQKYNPTYNKWYLEKCALDITFIESYCIMKGLKFDEITQENMK